MTKLKPALLASFVYLKQFLARKAELPYRDWVLDSGAYSAFNSGVVIDNLEYIETAKQLLATDPTLTEVFALDVIGDWRATLKNTEQAWEAGLPAIPAFHPVDDPWDILPHLAKTYPKIAVGGIAPLSLEAKRPLLAKVFAKVWPKKIHGFGIASKHIVFDFPFHSVDATSWSMQPQRYGRWLAFDSKYIRARNVSLRAELEWYMKLEQRMKNRWTREMQLLGEGETNTLRLATSGSAAEAALLKSVFDV